MGHKNRVKIYGMLASSSMAVFGILGGSTATASPTSGPASTAYVDGYGAATDLKSYINQIRVGSPVPGQVELAEAKAFDECGFLIMNPGAVNTDVSTLQAKGGKYANFRIQSLQRVGTRCKNFAFGTSMRKMSDQASLYNIAADAGNPEAIAHNLSHSIFASHLQGDDAVAKTQAVVSSGNPAALFTLSEAFSQHGPFKATPGGEVGSNYSTVAWRLVACDHGLDCSATSPAVFNACIYDAMCGPGDYRSNLQYSRISPEDFQKVVAIEGQINTAISNGSVQSFFTHK